MDDSSSGLSDDEFDSLLRAFGEKDRAVLAQVLPLGDELPPEKRHALRVLLRLAARTIPPIQRLLLSCRAEDGAVPSVDAYDSVIQSLCRDDDLPADFYLPPSALVGRTLSSLRLSFLKAVLSAARDAPRTGATGDHLGDLEEVLDTAVFHRLAEELLRRVVSNETNAVPLRRAAARRLAVLWDDGDGNAMGLFPSVLLSAWRGRRHVQTVYGTMFGSQELFALLRHQCEPRFLEHFTRDEVRPDEHQAFREFLFALSHEEIGHVEAHMREHQLSVVSRDQVERIIHRSLRSSEATGMPRAEEVWISYRRRRVRAEYRALAGLPGPRKTAEGYIMESILREDCGGKS